MKTDYPELEGKEVEIITPYNELYTGIVDGCNFDIGISISNKNDRNYHILCIHGPYYNKDNPNKSNYNKSTYKEEFNLNISMIRDGKIDGREHFKLLGIEEEYFGTVTCPFE